MGHALIALAIVLAAVIVTFGREVLYTLLQGRTMSQLDDKIAELTATVAAHETVDDSATALVNGFAQRLADAIAAATSAGASDAQLKAISDLNDALKAHADTLAAAV